MFDLWSDETPAVPDERRASSSCPASDDKRFRVTVTASKVTSNVSIHSVVPLERHKDFVQLHRVSTGSGSTEHEYELPLTPANAFVLRYLLAGYKGTSFTGDSAAVLKEHADRCPSPSVTLAEGGRHLELHFPPISLYRDIPVRLGAYPLSGGGYRLALTRLADFEILANSMDTKLPLFSFSEEVLKLNREPLNGFDGSLESLKTISISELNVIRANSQSYKNMKKSRKTLAEKMKGFGISTLHDLVMHLPKRYIDKSTPQQLGSFLVNEPVTILGKIESIDDIPRQMGVVFSVNNGDKHPVKVNFWRQSWLKSKFKVGQEVIVTGKMAFYRGQPQLSGTSIEGSAEAALMPVVPIYKQSESKGITTALLVSAVREMFSRMGGIELPEYLRGEGRINYSDALREIHLPSTLENHSRVTNSLAYYELVAMQIVIQSQREASDSREGISQEESDRKLQDKAIESLPFDLTAGQQKAVHRINSILASDRPGGVLLNADVGSGKGLLEDERVLTPSGWTTMKELSPGSRVVGKDGKPTTVLGVYPQGEQRVARLSFDDGSSIVTDMSHLWTVRDAEKERVISTGRMVEEFSNEKNSNPEKPSWEIPVLSGSANFSSTGEHRSIEPYSLGLWIRSYNHIPDAYLFANPATRHLVLQGILAACAIDSGNDVIVSNLPSVLAEDVRMLVFSLGGKATRIERQNGNVDVKVELTNREDTSRGLSRVITSVEELPEKARTICIKVDAADELFVTKDFIVTHNTVVSQLACLRAAEAGYQAVLVGPTEMLARQLHSTFERLVEGLERHSGEQVTLAYLSDALKAKEKREVLARVASGEVDIVVGTPGAMSPDVVSYRNLGLVVIDEQQKFGAEQRGRLLGSRADGRIPDILMQTATPMPRSVAQVFYGGFDMILLNEKPPGRSEIITEWIQEDPQRVIEQQVTHLWSDIVSEAEKGNSTFVISPHIEDSAASDVASVERSFEALSKGALSNLRVAVAHGRMKANEQNAIMQDFRDGKYDVLVASTVVEVGVDVPNATRVVVLSADRLGASSLHQIRGRVGRNDKPSKCYLVSNSESAASQMRLSSLVESSDGFEVAKADLKTRGEGNVLGNNQSGASDAVFSSLVRHGKWVNRAREEAKEILSGPHREQALEDSRHRFSLTEDHIAV